ncbi:hypothetical protein CLV47_12337 [Antricoccus suffuscus]|uniref:Mce-associated membrane protein n=1 Tax=Antricoccus suffuscus TaxID=1629062 RepID=A0A2T0ZEN4_9ACTN|nr:hypothetical protein [Antricoccus suffuscus]PRZ34805.1 hypothetical protein CLV47_12337 [Antricoccus suffuscus]
MRRRTSILLGVIVAGIITVAGCASAPADNHSTTPTQPAKSTGVSAKVSDALALVDRSDPVDVGRVFSEISCTWDPAIDATETAAVLRGADLMTPELAAQTVEPLRSASQAIFIQASEVGAISSAAAVQRADIHDGPSDTSDTKYLAYQVTWTWATPTGSDVAVDDPRTRTTYLILVRQPDQTWLVSSYNSVDQ